MRIRIRFGGERSRRVAKMKGTLGIERVPAERGWEIVRVVDIGPWLRFNPHEGIITALVGIDIEVLLTGEEGEFIRRHKDEVVKRVVRAECQEVDPVWCRFVWGERIEIRNIEVTDKDLIFTIQLKVEDFEDDLKNLSDVVQNLQGEEEFLTVHSIVEDMMREKR